MRDTDQIPLKPNNGYGTFAAWTLSVTALFIGIAELCGVAIDRGVVHVTLVRIAGIASSVVGMSAFALFLLATNVHILNCRTLRRISKEKSKDDSINNNQIIQNNQSNED